MSAPGWYRRNSPEVGILASGAAARMLVLKGGTMGRSRALTVAAAATLPAHQCEEYIFPGWYPGLLNGGLVTSDQPANYAVNTQSVLIPRRSRRVGSVWV